MKFWVLRNENVFITMLTMINPVPNLILSIVIIIVLFMSRSCKYLIVFGFPTKILNAFLICINIAHVGSKLSSESFSFPSHHKHHYRHRRGNCWSVTVTRAGTLPSILSHVPGIFCPPDCTDRAASRFVLQSLFRILRSPVILFLNKVFLLSLSCYSRFVFYIAMPYPRT
jgi:hypothetical protein